MNDVTVLEEAQAQAAWDRADTIEGCDPDHFRISDDAFRATIRRDRLNACLPFAWVVNNGRAVYRGNLPMMAALTKATRVNRRLG